MKPACPHCHGTGYLEPRDPGELLSELEATCRERGHWVSPDNRVRAETAAELIGQAPKTLSNWRSGDDRLPFIKRGGRPLYALNDLAEYLASA